MKHSGRSIDSRRQDSREAIHRAKTLPLCDRISLGNLAGTARVFLLALTLGCSLSVFAQAAAEPLAVTLTVSRVQVGADAKETLQEARAVKPDDILEYRAVYANRSGKPLSGVVANLPLPAGLDFQPGSAAPLSVLASTDGKEFRPSPLTRTVLRNGKEVQEQVPYSEYRALRWQLGQIEPGAEVAVKVRAKVSTGVGAAVTASAR